MFVTLGPTVSALNTPTYWQEKNTWRSCSRLPYIGTSRLFATYGLLVLILSYLS